MNRALSRRYGRAGTAGIKWVSVPTHSGRTYRAQGLPAALSYDVPYRRHDGTPLTAPFAVWSGQSVAADGFPSIAAAKAWVRAQAARAGHAHGPWAGMRFAMDRAKSSRGERGWQLAEVKPEGPVFRFWSPSSVEVRREAHRLGATETTLYIEGVPERDYRYTSPHG